MSAKDPNVMTVTQYRAFLQQIEEAREDLANSVTLPTHDRRGKCMALESLLMKLRGTACPMMDNRDEDRSDRVARLSELLIQEFRKQFDREDNLIIKLSLGKRI